MKFRPFLCAVLMLALLCGCACEPLHPTEPTKSTAPTRSDEDPLAAEWGEDQDEPDDPAGRDTAYIASSGWLVPGEFTYTGEPLSVSFAMDNGGRYAPSQSLMLWVNGIPQPYSLTPGGEVRTAHPIRVDGVGTREVTCFFTPVTGRAGETVRLTSCSVQDADLRYSNIRLVRHYIGHISGARTDLLHMQADAPAPADPLTVEKAESVPADPDFPYKNIRWAMPLEGTRLVPSGEQRREFAVDVAVDHPDGGTLVLLVNSVPYAVVPLQKSDAAHYRTVLDFDSPNMAHCDIGEINRLQAFWVDGDPDDAVLQPETLYIKLK